VGLFGAFNRLESKTQTKETALKQEMSGEIWGRTPRGGLEPTVQAYAGGLKHGHRGIEFSTDISPHPNGSPLEARWYLTKTTGVLCRYEGGEEFACIRADVKNIQP
jgi:hypothetical protein